MRLAAILEFSNGDIFAQELVLLERCAEAVPRRAKLGHCHTACGRRDRDKAQALASDLVAINATGDDFRRAHLAELDAVRTAPALTAHLETLAGLFAYEVITQGIGTARFPRSIYGNV